MNEESPMYLDQGPIDHLVLKVESKRGMEKQT
jgi:hypothetical protein